MLTATDERPERLEDDPAAAQDGDPDAQQHPGGRSRLAMGADIGTAPFTETFIQNSTTDVTAAGGARRSGVVVRVLELERRRRSHAHDDVPRQ